MSAATRRPPRARRAPARPEEGGRERLLEAATRLIAERGYAATSVGDVCAAARVARTALYWHFESKEGLLAAVVQSVGTRWIEEIQKRAYLEGDPLRRLDRLIEEWRRLLREEPELIRLPMVAQLEQGEASERVRAALRTVRERAHAALIEGIEDGLGISLPDLDLLAHTIVVLLQGAVVSRSIGDDEAQLDRIFGELRRTVLLLVWARLPEESREALTRLAGAR